MRKFATLSSKGQVVIPKEIRKFCDLRKNTKIVFELFGNSIAIKPIKDTRAQDLRKKLAVFSVDPNFRTNWEFATKRRTKGW